MPDLHSAGAVVAMSVTGLLVVASLVGFILSKAVTSAGGEKTVRNLNARTRAWWVMAGLFGLALWGGRGPTTVLFALMSFLALREILTLTPTRRGDHHTLFWAFFVAIPLHYWLIYRQQYGLMSILIPVYGFLILAIRSALSGDVTKYLERAAKIYWGVMICVYCLSHAPALLLMQAPHSPEDGWKKVVFLVLVVQLSDVLQYVWGKLLGKHKVAPNLSPSKTWEGLIGGVLSASLVGMAMYRLLPFTWWEAWVLSLVICVMGFFGGLVASAIKRDAGVKDYGQLIEGHGGMMDRIDSLAFAAPVFFHMLNWMVGHGWVR